MIRYAQPVDALIGERLFTKYTVGSMLPSALDVYGRSTGPRAVTAELGRIVISIRWYN